MQLTLATGGRWLRVQSHAVPYRPNDNLRPAADAQFRGQSEARAQFNGNRGGRRATRAQPVQPQLVSVTGAPFTGRSLASDSYQGQQGAAVQRAVRGARRRADHQRAVSDGAARFQGQSEAQASYQAQVRVGDAACDAHAPHRGDISTHHTPSARTPRVF